MSARIRKLVGMTALLMFVLMYVGAAVRIGESLPDHWAAKLAFYAIAGTAWGLPILPLITWMNRGR